MKKITFAVACGFACLPALATGCGGGSSTTTSVDCGEPYDYHTNFDDESEATDCRIVFDCKGVRRFLVEFECAAGESGCSCKINSLEVGPLDRGNEGPPDCGEDAQICINYLSDNLYFNDEE